MRSCSKQVARARCALLATAVGLLMSTVAAAGPVRFRITDLGTLGGRSSSATAINDLGQVIGYADTADGSQPVFRTSPNAPIDPATDDLSTPDGGEDDIASAPVREAAAWARQRTAAGTRADWQFTTADARVKLKRLRPVQAR